MPVYYEIPSEEHEGDNRIHPKEIPGDDEIPSDEEEGKYRIPQQFMPEDDKHLCEDQEGIERVSSKRKISYSKICLCK